MDCIQKKVWISNVFTINFKEMSILEDEIFMCVTPCKMDPLYTAGQCMCVCMFLLSPKTVLNTTKESWLILHLWMFLNYSIMMMMNIFY